MVFDVFISYPHEDKTIADAACATLEAEGVRCWIAPRDIAPSAEWAEAIVDAIDSCHVVVLIFSSHANRSKQIHREVQRAFDAEKPVVPFRIENVAPAKALAYYMGPVHWLDALTPPLAEHLKHLTKSVRGLLSAFGERANAGDESTQRGTGSPRYIAALFELMTAVGTLRRNLEVERGMIISRHFNSPDELKDLWGKQEPLFKLLDEIERRFDEANNKAASADHQAMNEIAADIQLRIVQFRKALQQFRDEYDLADRPNDV